MRKPGTGMARQAKKDFPEIDFSKSIIVGDSVSDMEFGRNAGMITIFAGDILSNLMGANCVWQIIAAIRWRIFAHQLIH